MSGRAGVVVLAALVPAVLLAVDPAGWYWFGPVKWLAVTTLVPIGSALVLGSRPTTFARTPTLVATALVAWLAVAAALGVDPLYAWLGTPERHLGVLAWALCLLMLVVGQSLDPTRDTWIVMGGVAIGGAAIGVLATAEALGWEPAVFDVGHRISATLGSPAYLGAATALLLPACVGLAAERAAPRALRRVARAAVAPLAVACLGSGARAAWVGLVASGCVVAFAHRGAIHRSPRVTVAAASGAMVIAVTFVVLVTPVGARVAATFDRDEPGGSGRLDEWRVATKVVADHLTTGVGPEGYRIAFADHVDAAYERAHGRDPLPDRAHSAPIDVALAGGLPALVAWTALVALVTRFVWRALQDGRRWLVGLAAGLVAYEVGQLLLFPIAELESVVWLLAGIVIAATARPSELRHRIAPRVLAPAFAIVGLVAACAGLLDVAADHRARTAVDTLAAGDTTRAADNAARASSLRPDEVRLHLLAARSAVADERGILTGLDDVERALDRSPHDPIARLTRATLLVDRARATLVPDHIARATDDVDELLAADPYNAQLLMLAGHVARLAGDTDRAENAWRRAEDLAPRSAGPPTALALSLLERGDVAAAREAIGRALARDPQDQDALAVQAQIDATR